MAQLLSVWFSISFITLSFHGMIKVLGSREYREKINEFYCIRVVCPAPHIWSNLSYRIKRHSKRLTAILQSHSLFSMKRSWIFPRNSFGQSFILLKISLKIFNHVQLAPHHPFEYFWIITWWTLLNSARLILLSMSIRLTIRMQNNSEKIRRAIFSSKGLRKRIIGRRKRTVSVSGKALMKKKYPDKSGKSEQLKEIGYIYNEQGISSMKNNLFML